jgi:homoserine kinase type II
VSVFTCITRPQLDLFFSAYHFGQVVGYEGITDGIDNTNYFVTTEQGSFVLTIFESLTRDDLPHFLNLMSHLGRNNLPCPSPQADRQRNVWRQFGGKPAAVFKRLPGKAIASPTILHCQEIGLQLASLHRCTEGYVFPVDNNNGLAWCEAVSDKLSAHLPAADLALLKDELAYQLSHSSVDLPRGVIHADLFRDNVLFVDDRLSGLLDFYSACTDTLLLDVAITANDWCCDNGVANKEKITAFLAAYESLRPLELAERRQWPTLLRAAALRFWLSRLEHRHYPRAGELIQQKDPLVFRDLLLQHRQQSYSSNNKNTFNFRSTA